MLQQQVRARCNAGADQEECRRGNIRRHINVHRRQCAAAGYADGIAVALHRVTHAGQHALGMIAGRRGLAHAGLTFGVQARQQQAGFYLCAGYRHVVMNTLQGLPAANFQRRCILRGGIDMCAHERQWPGYAAHGATHQRVIANQFQVKVLPGQQTG